MVLNKSVFLKVPFSLFLSSLFLDACFGWVLPHFMVVRSCSAAFFCLRVWRDFHLGQFVSSLFEGTLMFIHSLYSSTCISDSWNLLVRLCRGSCFQKEIVFVWCISCLCLFIEVGVNALFPFFYKGFSPILFQRLLSHLRDTQVDIKNSMGSHPVSLKLFSDCLSDVWSWTIFLLGILRLFS